MGEAGKVKAEHERSVKAERDMCVALRLSSICPTLLSKSTNSETTDPSGQRSGSFAATLRDCAC